MSTHTRTYSPVHSRLAPRPSVLQLIVVAALSLLLLAVASRPAEAQATDTPIDERHALAVDGSVVLQVVTHNLLVRSWDRDEIRVTGEYRSDREDLSVRAESDRFVLEIEHRDRRGSFQTGERTIEVWLPRSATLEAANVSGSVRAEELGGTDVVLTTVSGDAILDRALVGEARLTSVSGDVTFDGEADRIAFRSVSGDLTMSGMARHIEGNTVSGAADLAFARTPDARFELASMSGSLSHEIAGARDVREDRDRFGPRRQLSFVSGDGSGSIAMRTVSGSMRVR